jgi:hypothetical protein
VEEVFLKKPYLFSQKKTTFSSLNLFSLYPFKGEKEKIKERKSLQNEESRYIIYTFVYHTPKPLKGQVFKSVKRGRSRLTVGVVIQLPTS